MYVACTFTIKPGDFPEYATASRCDAIRKTILSDLAGFGLVSSVIVKTSGTVTIDVRPCNAELRRKIVAHAMQSLARQGLHDPETPPVYMQHIR